MRKTDLVVASLFLALGIYLFASSFGLPEGLGALPGPGFFPRVIGALIAILGAILLAQSRRGDNEAELRLDNGQALAVTVGLLAAFLLLWGVIPFAVRSMLFVILFLRFLGERWRTATAVAAVLTLAVLLAFQYGLRLSLE